MFLAGLQSKFNQFLSLKSFIMITKGNTCTYLNWKVNMNGTILENLIIIIVLRALAKARDIKSHSSVCPSVCLSVTKTLSWLISSVVLKIEYWYLACMILVTRLFHWHHWPWPLTFSRSNLLPRGGPQFSEFACWSCFTSQSTISYIVS